MSFSGPTTAVPDGFHVTRLDKGYLEVTYQTTGLGQTAWHDHWPAIICTATSVFGTLYLLFRGAAAVFEGEDGDLLLIVILAWIGTLYILPITLRYFWSVTIFTFGPDRLVVERGLFGFYRRRELPKHAIHGVRQVLVDYGDVGNQRRPSTWSLVVNGEVNATLLSNQLLEKSDWLGPLVAQWAGVEFEQWSSSKPDNAKPRRGGRRKR